MNQSITYYIVKVWMTLSWTHYVYWSFYSCDPFYAPAKNMEGKCRNLLRASTSRRMFTYHILIHKIIIFIWSSCFAISCISHTPRFIIQSPLHGDNDYSKDGHQHANDDDQSHTHRWKCFFLGLRRSKIIYLHSLIRNHYNGSKNL